MKLPFLRRLLSLVMVCGWAVSTSAELPSSDQRASKVKDQNTPWKFTEPKSKSEWQARAKDIREHALVSCGLWPMPEKTPLNAQVFGKVERDGYSIEKVHFQTYPGFYLAGNLYRPLGKGSGPFPAVLNPHGHWNNGRMADDPGGSIAARCISFARMGMVAFSYDMVGYNDTIQLGKHRAFFLRPELQLWSINLMGLQTWNSIRALDFLETLPDVDPKRLACTGESGGGTQTFMLGAVDDRLALQAPIVMVSHSMQGGCQCENAPGLRLDHFNVEIAGVAAPRPQILVAATGDWTKATMTTEGPALERIYALFKANDKLRYKIFDFNHNYNQTSREAVYAWFNRWLLRQPDAPSFPEAAYKKEPDADLRVFPGDKLPADALTEAPFIRSLIEAAKTQVQQLKPVDRKTYAHFKEIMTPAYRHTLALEFPERGIEAEMLSPGEGANYTSANMAVGRTGKGDRIPVTIFYPRKDAAKSMIVLVHPQGRSALMNKQGEPLGLAKTLVDRGLSVLLLDTFMTGQLYNAAAADARKTFDKMFTTYNRTDLQERVQDIVTVCALAQNHSKLGRRPTTVVGMGRAGAWALLAAPAADAVVADCDGLDTSNEQVLLSAALFSPGFLKMGGFECPTALAASNPLVLHNTGSRFGTSFVRAAYTALGTSKLYREEANRMEDEAVADVILRMKK
jgi:dienelactone hydrolase